MKSFRLKIVTPQGVYLEEEIEMLNIQIQTGQVGILAGHMPLASGIEVSKMNYLQNNQRKEFVIMGGFLYVDKEQTTIVTNAIEAETDIDVDRATKAKERAEKRLQDGNETIDVERAKKALDRANLRIETKQ